MDGSEPTENGNNRSKGWWRNPYLVTIIVSFSILFVGLYVMTPYFVTDLDMYSEIEVQVQDDLRLLHELVFRLAEKDDDRIPKLTTKPMDPRLIREASGLERQRLYDAGLRAWEYKTCEGVGGTQFWDAHRILESNGCPEGEFVVSLGGMVLRKR